MAEGAVVPPDAAQLPLSGARWCPVQPPALTCSLPAAESTFLMHTE